jgi:hypothetical protein
MCEDSLICKKIIKDFDCYIVIGYGIPLPQYSMCSDCASPVITFLETHGLRSFTDEQSFSWNAAPEDTFTDVLE